MHARTESCSTTEDIETVLERLRNLGRRLTMEEATRNLAWRARWAGFWDMDEHHASGDAKRLGGLR